jgi:hypothetical protein
MKTHLSNPAVQRFYKAFGLVAVALALCNCPGPDPVVVDPLPRKSILPHAVGNYWEFTGEKFDTMGRLLTEDSARVEIVRNLDITFDSMVYPDAFTWSWRVYPADTLSHTQWLYWEDDSGSIWIFGGITGKGTYAVSKSINYKYPVRTGDSWPCDYITVAADTFRVDSTYIKDCSAASETLTTEAGAFNCVVYHSQARYLSGWEDIYSYYSPGVGYVGYIYKYKGVVIVRRLLRAYRAS